MNPDILSQHARLLRRCLLIVPLLLIQLALADDPEPIPAAAEEQTVDTVIALALDSVSSLPEPPPPMVLLDKEVRRGTLERRQWSGGQPIDGLSSPTPVLVAAGSKDGPVVCLTAAIHGDELNGVEMIRRIMYTVDVSQLSGTIIGVPIVNLQGFRRASRYLPDRRDLNRYFPGSPDGSAAARIAHAFFNDIVRHCDWLIDLHTGSFHRTNLPQLRADLNDEQVRKLSNLFGEIVVLHGKGAAGTLRRAAVDHGIPAVTLEAGEPLRLQPYEVQRGVAGIKSVLEGLGMLPAEQERSDRQYIYRHSVWLRANQSGILFSEVSLGNEVEKGEILGSVTDPITNETSEIRATAPGRILGMALNQMVMPGFAAYHLGITPKNRLPGQRSQAGKEDDTDIPRENEEYGDDKQSATPVAVPEPAPMSAPDINRSGGSEEPRDDDDHPG